MATVLTVAGRGAGQRKELSERTRGMCWLPKFLALFGSEQFDSCFRVVRKAVHLLRAACSFPDMSFSAQQSYRSW